MRKVNLILYFCIFFILIFSSNVFASELKNSEVLNEKNYYEMKESCLNIYSSNMFSNIYSSSSSNDVFDTIVNEIVEQGTKNVDENLVYDSASGFQTRYFNIFDYNITLANIDELITKVYERPELFYNAGIWYRYYSNGLVNDICVQYYLNQEQIDSELEKINEETEKFINGCDSTWTNLEKILYTHDYICKSVNYNYTAANSDATQTDLTKIYWRTHRLNGVLVDKSPVCDGYSRGMVYLLEKLGISSSLVTSTSMNHAWNLVNLNNKYYHVDSTWDDMNCDGRAIYEYFLVSDTEMPNRSHSDYSALNIANSTIYDDTQIWNKTVSFLNYYKDYWYYLDIFNVEDEHEIYTSEIVLNKVDLNNNKYIFTKNIQNSIFENKINYSPCLTTDGKYLYFNGYDKIYFMDFNGENVSEFYNPEITEKIYCLMYWDSLFYYDTLKYNMPNYYLYQNVYIPVQKIELSEDELTLNLTSPSYTLQASIYPEDISKEKTIIWSSSNDDIVEIDSAGNVKACKEGTVVITAECDNCVAECTITVQNNSTSTSSNTNKNTTTNTATNTNKNTTTNTTTNTNKNTTTNSATNTNKNTITNTSTNTNKATATTTTKIVLPFKDVKKTDWFYKAVEYTYSNNIISGYNKTTFAPNDKITRAMMVTILYRMEGSPNNNGKSKFSDVPSNEWYSKAIKWASEKGIVNGYGGTNKFGPNDNIIRQDLAGILRNYAKYKKKNTNITADLTKFKDYKKVEAYALSSMKWAVGSGVITGNSNGTLNPKGNATRAEAAAMIQKYCNKVGR